MLFDIDIPAYSYLLVKDLVEYSRLILTLRKASLGKALLERHAVTGDDAVLLGCAHLLLGDTAQALAAFRRARSLPRSFVDLSVSLRRFMAEEPGMWRTLDTIAPGIRQELLDLYPGIGTTYHLSLLQ